MKATALALLGIVILLMGVAALKGDGTFQLGLKKSLFGGGKFLPVLLLAFLIMGFTEALLPQQFIREWLTDSAGWRGIVIAWVAGALTPAGSLVGLPLAASLFKAGVGIGVLITYLTSVALLSTIRIPLELGIYGPKLTLLRVLSSILLPPLAGLFARFLWKFLAPL